MRINAVRHQKTYLLRHFNVGDVVMCTTNNHFMLVVESENNKTQLVDLNESKIIREGSNLSLVKADGEININSIG